MLRGHTGSPLQPGQGKQACGQPRGIARRQNLDQESRLWPAGGLLLSLLLLALCQQAGKRLLSPQTGDWLAGCCQLVLQATAALAAAVGAGLHGRHLCRMRGTAAVGKLHQGRVRWWLAAVLALAAKPAVRFVGSCVLAPGLAASGSSKSREWATAEVTGRSLLLAATSLGLLFASLGWQAGSTVAALLPASITVYRRNLAGMLLAPLVELGGLAALQHVPLAAAVPKPACTLPAAVALMAAAVAVCSSLAGRPHTNPPPASTAARGRPSTRRGRHTTDSWQIAACVVVAAVAAAQLSQCYACTETARAPAGSQFKVLWRCEAAAGGIAAVVEGTLKGAYKYRVLRFDHSLLGGQYTSPPAVAGQSVYTAFYLQLAVLLLYPPQQQQQQQQQRLSSSLTSAPASGSGSPEVVAGDSQPRALLIGLGIGTAAAGLQAAGVKTDAVELHAEVVQAAKQYFSAQLSGPITRCQLPAFLAANSSGGIGAHSKGSGSASTAAAAGLMVAGDALKVVPLLPDARYDYIIHDVFSGGGVADALLSEAFIRLLHGKLRGAPSEGAAAGNAQDSSSSAGSGASGILAVNFYGRQGTELHAVACRLRSVFASVRVFADLEEGQRASGAQNFVLFASDSDLGSKDVAAAAAVAAAAPGTDPMQQAVLEGLAGQEVSLDLGLQHCQQRLQRSNSSGGGLWPRLRAGLSSWQAQHAAAVEHWVTMRRQIADAVWLDY